MFRVVLALLVSIIVSMPTAADAGWRSKALVVVGGAVATKLAPVAVRTCLRNPRCSAWAARMGRDALESAILSMGASEAIRCIASDTCAFLDRSAPAIDPYIPAPPELKGFPGAQKAKPKTITAAGKKRARWKLPDGRIAEWDSQHGEVELYDRKGRHICAADPETGQCVKDAVPGRRIEP